MLLIKILSKLKYFINTGYRISLDYYGGSHNIIGRTG